MCLAVEEDDGFEADEDSTAIATLCGDGVVVPTSVYRVHMSTCWGCLTTTLSGEFMSTNPTDIV